MEILFLLGLIMLNGVFAMSEISLIASKRPRLKKLAAEGDRGAAAALELGEDPTRFMSTVQIGITSISILNGIVGESVLAEPLSKWLLSMGVAEKTASVGATALVVIAITYVSIVVGELVPKRIGQIKPEAIARAIARPMQWLALFTRPFIKLLTLSTNALLALLGVKQDGAHKVTQEEIKEILEEGSESGAIEKTEHQIVKNVFKLDDRQLTSLMISGSKVVNIDIERPLEENLKLLVETRHSRFPLVRGGLHDVLGVLHVKQVLTFALRGEKPDFTANLQPCIYVPETITGMELLENFRANHISIAFVVDERGDVRGIVTLHDLLEAVLGEFTPADPEDAWARRRDDGTWLLDGGIPMAELRNRLELKSLPEEDKGRYHTLSGLVMLLLARVPRTGDRVDWDGWRFEVVDMDGKRIDKVLASPWTSPP
jgi:putative hemolysin